MKKITLALSLILVAISLHAQSSASTNKKKFLIHITVGPESPTRAALGFLVARSAIDEGHSVTLFLAGDAVQLLRNSVLDNLTGLGTGKLREHYDVIATKGGRFYLSGMSSKARGLLQDDLKDKPAEFAMPEVLVRLAVESDRMFVY